MSGKASDLYSWGQPKLKSDLRLLKNGILLPKLLRHTVRKKCSSDQEKLLKFEAEGREFENVLRSQEQCIQTVKGQKIFWKQSAFLTFPADF